jgi:endonuclease/exonuclease/phosphatase family metal-dependent hydrolase
VARLRVVAWNIDNKPAAWDALETLAPDIALLNEAMPPTGSQGIWSPDGTWGRDRGKRPWCAAVLSRHPLERITDAKPRWRHSVRDVRFECSRPGSWEAARVDTPKGDVTAIALYGLMDELSDSSVHRSLSELSPALDDARYNDLVVLGGDLNTGTQWSDRERQWRLRDAAVLARIEAYGLVDCLQSMRPEGRLEGCGCVYGDECRHTRTRKDRRFPAVAYQTDYLFASPKLASHLVSCKALATDEWFSISDHAPIVAEFDL